MIINGFQLREAIRQWELTRDGAANAFDSTLRKFADEFKPTPQVVMSEFVIAEQNIARLQLAQATYNLQVKVMVFTDTITLLEAVKRLGGAGRAAKMWRVAAGGEEKRRRAYGGYTEDVRKTDETRAEPTITRAEALTLAKISDKFASALRAAIAKGNATDLEIELDPALVN